MKVPISQEPTCSDELKKVILEIKADFLEAVSSLGRNYRDDWRKAVKRISDKWGFEEKITEGLSTYIFVSTKYGVVLKRPCICSGDGRMVKPPFAIFTEMFKPKKRMPSYSSYKFILIQPLADVSEKSKEAAYRIISRVNNNAKKRYSDLHENNVAIYDGKAVAIDW